MDTRVEKLISAIGRLREYNHTRDDVNDIKTCLNLIFNPSAKCEKFIYTINTDKLPFGCIVFPSNSAINVNTFMITGETDNIDSFEVELDSKMFDYGLDDDEVAQMILFNIYHLIKNSKPLENVRDAIDVYFMNNSNNLVIRNSVQYQSILKLGLMDALSQCTSCLYLPDDIESDAYLESLGLDGFDEMLDKVYKKIPGCEVEATRQPKLTMLEWALRLYNNIDTERIPALHLLNKVKTLTASVLYINKFNAAIFALNHIDNELAVNEATLQVFTESKRKHGLLASLKYSGLRDIEYDLYEFKVRAKNAESMNDVMYALKQINARLAILDDYIKNNPDDPELDRWIAVKIQYMDIRDELAKKKLHKKEYGIFVDYDALDKLDNPEDDE